MFGFPKCREYSAPIEVTGEIITNAQLTDDALPLRRASFLSRSMSDEPAVRGIQTNGRGPRSFFIEPAGSATDSVGMSELLTSQKLRCRGAVVICYNARKPIIQIIRTEENISFDVICVDGCQNPKFSSGLDASLTLGDAVKIR